MIRTCLLRRTWHRRRSIRWCSRYGSLLRSRMLHRSLGSSSQDFCRSFRCAYICFLSMRVSTDLACLNPGWWWPRYRRRVDLHGPSHRRRLASKLQYPRCSPSNQDGHLESGTQACSAGSKLGLVGLLSLSSLWVILIDASLGRTACERLWKGSNAPQILTGGGSRKSLTDLCFNVRTQVTSSKLLLVRIHVSSPPATESIYVRV